MIGRGLRSTLRPPNGKFRRIALSLRRPFVFGAVSWMGRGFSVYDLAMAVRGVATPLLAFSRTRKQLGEQEWGIDLHLKSERIMDEVVGFSFLLLGSYIKAQYKQFF